MPKKIRLLSILLLAAVALHAQLPGPAQEALPPLSVRDLNVVDGQVSRLDRSLTGKAEKYLKQMAAEEARLKSRLQKTDPAAADKLFRDITERYGQLQASLRAANPGSDNSLTGYVPSLDTLKSTLLFLKNNK